MSSIGRRRTATSRLKSGPRVVRADGATPLLATLEWASAAQCPTHGPDDGTSPLAVAAAAVDLTADSEVKATLRQDGLGGGLGGKPPPNSRLPPLPGWPSAWTLVGSEYYLRHLRTSACGTRARTGPCSSGHFAFFEDSPKAQAEELPTFIFGGSPKRSRQADLSKAQAEELPTFIFGGGPKQADTSPSQYKSFCQRTKRKLVQEFGDGHCGIRSLWRQFDKAIGEENTSINPEHIRNGQKN